ncbi:MAG: iron-sulfur cluster repair di-iron protein [Acidobacteriaceae bacterium]|jgi:regulator of cell morphogenesis and NO signaling
MTATTQTVREIALDQPTSIRVFEQFGIDYCCGGRKPLAEACAASNLEVDAVLAALESAAQGSAPVAEDWSKASLEALSAHIVATHHAYVKSELPRLAVLAEKVVRRHGDTQAELPLIQAKLALLDEELTQHLAKEEVVLFPYVTKLERALETGSTLPRGCFGTVANPIAMMTAEHDAAGGLLAEIRQLSHHFTTPAGACPTYHAFYDGLREFEQDLHQHIHLENNILFPRAIALEAGALVTSI